MSESQPESNTFDDFEKLDEPTKPTVTEDSEETTEVVSSSVQEDIPEDDLYSKSPEREEPPPLVDLDEKTPPVVELKPTMVTKPQVLPSGDGCCTMNFCSSFWMKNIDPRVLDLIYWRDTRRTSVVFASLLLLLVSFALYSALMVVAYVSMAILAVTLSFRIYRQVLSSVQKTGEGNPFKIPVVLANFMSCLEEEIVLPEEKIQEIVEMSLSYITIVVNHTRRLFFVADFFDSLKFGICLWILSYVGACFNGITLVIIALIKLFTLPKVYETYKVQIDAQLTTVSTNVSKIYEQVQNKIPLLKKKAE